ncbi:acyl-CoA thioesterase [Planktothrix sp. FACHB-1355]|uniref:1,4-dihydroxy-2-naphthoyl-CoA hydrolase n=1 Tax=Aerosakkonema funiforme FACHB-1375 TaxID=2949571 RepID=A0A926VAJ4_9CYAN|nr:MULTISPECIES: thioesterase family protein [Oscillatoriales]MBD2180283.1 acyl-CoA thioesterase [Aerosakkonema funiforme FACHB-1375]MBD3558849.1 acyl-CoA thioesterase [Planktothrix sp. FACHB-1355]
MPFSYTRTIRFQDTDAAGVVYFANVLPMCHEAYEESLVASGINIRSFFSTNSGVAIPIIHASVDFLRPMFCGDKIIIYLFPKSLTSNKFEIEYQIFDTKQQQLAKAMTRHACIDPTSRSRKELPTDIIDWLQDWNDLDATK